MLVKFFKEWKDYDEGDVIEIADSIAEGLVLGGICENTGFTSKRDAEGSITAGIQYKKASLKRVQNDITVLTRRIDSLKEKESSLLKEIDGFDFSEKASEGPAKDKQFKKYIKKEVTKNAE